MAGTRPDVDDLIAFKKLVNVSEEKTAALEEVLAAATAFIEDDCNMTEGMETDYPVRLRMAILLHASRLSSRATSPSGVAGWAGDQSVRVMAFDPDVASLIAPFQKIEFG